MSQMRLNPLTGRWVTIVAERARRPSDFAPRDRQVESEPGRRCPFCPGNEDASLPALETVDDGSGWSIRVVPNLYPAFDGETGFVVHHVGPVHVTAEASGIHEVFVYTPHHDGGFDQLSDHEATDVMHACSVAWRPTPRRPRSATARSSSTTAARPGRRSPTPTPRSSASRSCPARSSTRSGRSPASPGGA